VALALRDDASRFVAHACRNNAFVDGRQDLDAVEAQVRAEVEALGGVALVVFDTRAAFFHRNELNCNPEVGDEARRYRRSQPYPAVQPS
jgi:hypothetical protein